MKNSKGVSLIALIITIIVIIILAAIVMNSSGDTVTQAQYAKFAQEFGEFESQVKLDAASVKQSTGLRGQSISPAQQYYMVANGWTTVLPGSGDYNKAQGVAGYTMPVGYVVTNHNTTTGERQYILQAILKIGSGDTDTTKTIVGTNNVNAGQNVAYVINDGKITNYEKYGDNLADGSASHEFYGDSNGKEYHFITSDGNVFTLPGYPVTQSDGTIEYHIDTQTGHYYVVAGNSGKTVGTPNVNGDPISCSQPIQASYLTETHGIDAITGKQLGSNGEHVAGSFSFGQSTSDKALATDCVHIGA
jgi:type II secretory pathway pseudopilin PulG